MKTLLLGLLLLVSCATPYQKSGFSGGYSEEMVGKNMYEVTFRGNGYTGRDKVQRYLKRRCAELAKEKGFTHFAVVSTGDRGRNKPVNTQTIKLLNNPGEDSMAFDAEMILSKVD